MATAASLSPPFQPRSPASTSRLDASGVQATNLLCLTLLCKSALYGPTAALA
jgi:hypothetical protein